MHPWPTHTNNEHGQDDIKQQKWQRQVKLAVLLDTINEIQYQNKLTENLYNINNSKKRKVKKKVYSGYLATIYNSFNNNYLYKYRK